jgi:hypothetical protein
MLCRINLTRAATHTQGTYPAVTRQHWTDQRLTVTATVLFNAVGFGYLHLRASLQWQPAGARQAVLDLVLNCLLWHPDQLTS